MDVPSAVTTQPESPKQSLFSRDTLEDLQACTAEAAQALERGDAEAARTVEQCRQISQAVTSADSDAIDDARRVFNTVLPGCTDPRLLFVGYQFFFRTGDYDASEHLVRRRLELAPPESTDAARAWTNLGLIYFFRNDFEKAESMMRTALDIDTRIGNEFGMARDLGNLSLIPEKKGDFDFAERLNLEALTIAERIGATPLIASRLCNLGEIAMARGRSDVARPYLERAMAAFASLGIEKNRALCESHLKVINGVSPQS
jgi:tetratricopeptide (TPR) repeat protein